MISSEYGWTDETILDLKWARIRQITAAITLRKNRERVYSESIAEWQTKVVSQIIAATVPLEKKGASNPVADAANAISIFPEADATPANREPLPGSFERFMSMAGG